MVNCLPDWFDKRSLVAYQYNAMSESSNNTTWMSMKRLLDERCMIPRTSTNKVPNDE